MIQPISYYIAILLTTIKLLDQPPWHSPNTAHNFKRTRSSKQAGLTEKVDVTGKSIDRPETLMLKTNNILLPFF